MLGDVDTWWYYLRCHVVIAAVSWHHLVPAAVCLFECISMLVAHSFGSQLRLLESLSLTRMLLVVLYPSLVQGANMHTYVRGLFSIRIAVMQIIQGYI